MKTNHLLTLFVCAVALILPAASARNKGEVPTGSKVFIAPMDGGLDGFVATEMLKKKIPVKIVTDEKDADFVLTGGSVKADDHWYNTVFNGKDKNEGNVRLMNVKEKALVWAGEAGDRSLFWKSKARRTTEGRGSDR